MTLHLFTVFHANLDFSSLPDPDLPLVLDRCYWPLLRMAEEDFLPLGVEMPSRTLERLEREDPEWVKTFRALSARGLVELVGSGLAQIVGPLVPEDVNRDNFRMGVESYVSLLGEAPTTWFVNEQTFSAGVGDLYAELGVHALVCEWNNPASFRPELRPLRCAVPRLHTTNGTSVRVLWNDCVLFQRLQRFVRGEISLESYLHTVRSNSDREAERVRCAYGSDLEIFDFRPGSSPPEDGVSGREVARLRMAFAELAASPGVVFRLPRSVPERLPEGPAIELASSADPVPCKKQPRYNPTRWAVSGRGGLDLNTRCFALRRVQRLAGAPVSDTAVRERISLWRSDLRTRATEEKWSDFQERCGAALLQARSELEHVAPPLEGDADALLWNPHPDPWPAEPVEISLCLAAGRLPAATVAAEPANALPREAAQVEVVDRHRDGSLRRVTVVVAPRLEAGQALAIRLVRGPGVPGVQRDAPPRLATPAVDAEFLSQRGGALAALSFPSIAERPLVGTISHGTFDHIAYTPDFYSGLVVAHTEGGEKITNLARASSQWEADDPPLRSRIRFDVETPLGRWTTHYRIYHDRPRLDMVHELELRAVRLRSLRLGVLTMLPDSFDRGSLHYATVNGGPGVEDFEIPRRCVIEQSRAVSASVSATSCLGATEGWVSLGDRTCGVAVIGDRAAAAVVPMLDFADVDAQPFFRVHHSAAESDETQTAFFRGMLRFPFALVGHHDQLQSVRETARAIERGLVVRTRRGTDVARAL